MGLARRKGKDWMWHVISLEKENYTKQSIQYFSRILLHFLTYSKGIT